MSRLFGVGDEVGEDAILGKLEGMKDVIEKVNRQFKDPVKIQKVNRRFKIKMFDLFFFVIGFDNFRLRMHP